MDIEVLSVFSESRNNQQLYMLASRMGLDSQSSISIEWKPTITLLVSWTQSHAFMRRMESASLQALPLCWGVAVNLGALTFFPFWLFAEVARTRDGSSICVAAEWSLSIEKSLSNWFIVTKIRRMKNLKGKRDVTILFIFTEWELIHHRNEIWSSP